MLSVLRVACSLVTYDGVCEVNFTLSHRKRIEINRKCNNHFLQPGAVWIPRAPGRRAQLNAPQPMWVWPGLKMLGCVAIEKQGIRNACEYTISAVNETTVTLKDGPTLTHEQASEWLRLPFCRTYASIQGLELDCSLGLHDLDCSHFTLRHLYVALSRAKTAALVRCF